MESTSAALGGKWFHFRALCIAALGVSCGVFLGNFLPRTWLLGAVCVFLLCTLFLVLFGKPRAALFFAALAAGALRMGVYRFLPLSLQDVPAIAAASASLNGLRDALFSASDAVFINNAPLMKGMLFGYRAELSPSVTNAFRDTGLAHILALSGMNISLYALLLLRFIPKKYRLTRFFGVGAFSLLYCAVAAFPASLVRAAVMTQCALLSGVFRRRNDLLSSLSLSSVLILLAAPAQLYDIGYELSFAAVFAIALFYEPLAKMLRFLGREISASVSVTFCGTLGTLPLSAHYFGSFAWLTLFSNLLILPVASFALIVGLIAVLLYFVSPALCYIPGLLGDAAASITVRAAELIASLPFATSHFPRLPFAALFLFYLAMAFLSRYNLQKPAVRYLSGGVVLLFAALFLLVL